ncbi:MAG: hypothetical protein M3018_04150 [Actinomycetota bacterium]|nr:hypothetical protein [Actinomycetota bacterium]
MLKNVFRIAVLLAVSVWLAACGGGSTSSSTSSAGSSTSATSTSATTPAPQLIGFEGMPIEQGADLAPSATTGTGTVDGISCGAGEQLAYHIHSHLAVSVNGSLRALPGGVGIPGSRKVIYQGAPVATGGQCIYWLHTHAPDGVIHIESPSVRLYTLGDFFDEWRQPLSRHQVGDASGVVTAIVNGKPWTRNLRAIPLLPHEVIQLDVGFPKMPFQPVSWSGLQL